MFHEPNLNIKNTELKKHKNTNMSLEAKEQEALPFLH